MDCLYKKKSCIFRKRWNLILGCFFHVSILKASIGTALNDFYMIDFS